ncbi:XRE family transcriptional regulator [Botrimarina mediterranea]|uniref:XRE family transcriptional regulator n=1 Tax=Botrimarina mediterranea TaxID=2528022 RepID=UPI00118C9164|nr:helix-turn-helix protein [Planctomycetes bacterium K2D]
MATKYAFEPDYTVAPGETLKETLEHKGLTQSDLAIRTGMAKKTVSQIINGVAPITHETAEKLEFATGVPATFWNRRELVHREALLRESELKKMQSDAEWLAELPMAELVKRGCLPKLDDKAQMVRAALKFFGVSGVEAWRQAWMAPAAQYRGRESQQRYPGYVAAWLRMGEVQAESVPTMPFDAHEFRRALDNARGLTTQGASTWLASLQSLCSPAGVAIVLTKEIPNAGISGATRWMTKDRALIQLSLKYKSDDQFWFTFFHEAGHILLHSKKELFMEFGTDGSGELCEQEANLFARDHLIPPEVSHQLPYLKSKVKIRQFAASIGIAPGIVVGRLHKDELLPMSHCHDLKRKLEWRS